MRHFILLTFFISLLFSKVDTDLPNLSTLTELGHPNHFSTSTSVLTRQATLGYQIGDIVDDFTLLNTDEKFVSLKDFPEAKGFIIVFTCNHCPYSVAYEDRLIALDKKYKKKGYPVIAINPNNPAHYPIDSYKNMKERAKNKGFTFPYLFDDGQKVYPQFGATKTPHTFVLKKTKKGNRIEYIGAIDNNIGNAVNASKKFVELAIEALIEGKEPSIRETKAIGCSIKI